jgi:hypothetical protein
VEFKHQNISAVLEKLGEPWIPGYKPAQHFQINLVRAVERYIVAHREGLYEQPPPKILGAAEESRVFIDPPQARVGELEDPPELQNLIKKFDPVARDFRNRQLGAAGEKFVLEFERRRLITLERPDLARKVRWVAAEDGDGAGYDVLSFAPDGAERLIEVKTTNGSARTPFFLTRNEREVADTRVDVWRLYRVHLFAQKPRVFSIAPPLEKVLSLRTQAWRAAPL